MSVAGVTGRPLSLFSRSDLLVLFVSSIYSRLYMSRTSFLVSKREHEEQPGRRWKVWFGWVCLRMDGMVRHGMDRGSACVLTRIESPLHSRTKIEKSLQGKAVYISKVIAFMARLVYLPSSMNKKSDNQPPELNTKQSSIFHLRDRENTAKATHHT